ncbi:MAG: GNAT family N-acetyltransferase [Candidatus Heimdallarchaeota archaeon]|nr:GNAT family N-acetyltransferase [Candidatus Heimdallarchaeota archaeon]
MSDIYPDYKIQQLLDLNEYGFYAFMPDSDVVKNDLGYFIKNKSIETYSYVSPTDLGAKNFDDFLSFTYSYFSDGKEYFIVKHALDEYFKENSKTLRQKQLIPYHLDIGMMHWQKDAKDMLNPLSHVEYELLPSKKVKKWVDVFFDAFVYPRSLRRYIIRMATAQSENGIEFFVGYVSNKDVSCFCSFNDGIYRGIYGVGTRLRYRRRGYASILMSNYILETLKSDPKAKFCLQVQKRSGAETLYSKLGFIEAVVQKRFDWDPSVFKSSS